MTDIQALLEEFRQFALSGVNESKNEIELDDLMLQWYDSKDAELINATIRQGLPTRTLVLESLQTLSPTIYGRNLASQRNDLCGYRSTNG